MASEHLHAKHQAEMQEMHKRHEKEHKDMHSRHEAEHLALTGEGANQAQGPDTATQTPASRFYPGMNGPAQPPAPGGMNG